MKHVLVLLIVTLFIGCNNSSAPTIANSPYFIEIEEIRKNKNKSFLQEGSPIPNEMRKNFLGLNYFPIDSTYRVKAAYNPIFDLKVVSFRTNTERSPKYIAFANLVFNVKGVTDTLTAYKDASGKSNELFVPFTDLSNGKKSYATGRYLDLSLPEGDSVVLDFNLAYNPYCAYNKKYSCPIPPINNRVNLEILAGESLFTEH